MKHFLQYALVLVTLLLAGCKRDICKELEIVESSATITWTGDYAVDGCGYRVQIGEQRYKPEKEEDIDPAFKSYEPTSVKLKYILRGKRNFQCGMLSATNDTDFILVLSIEKI